MFDISGYDNLWTTYKVGVSLNLCISTLNFACRLLLQICDTKCNLYPFNRLTLWWNIHMNSRTWHVMCCVIKVL